MAAACARKDVTSQWKASKVRTEVRTQGHTPLFADSGPATPALKKQKRATNRGLWTKSKWHHLWAWRYLI